MRRKEGLGGWQDLQLPTASVGNAVHGTEGTGIVGSPNYGIVGRVGFELP